MVSELYRKNGAGGAGEAGEVFQAKGMYVKHLKQELDGLMQLLSVSYSNWKVTAEC